MKEALRDGAFLKWDDYTISTTYDSKEALGISALVQKVLSLTAQEQENDERIALTLEGYQDILEALKTLSEQSGRTFYGRILNVIGLQTPVQRRLAEAQRMIAHLISTLKGQLRVRYSFVEGIGRDGYHVGQIKKLPEAERELYGRYAFLSLICAESFSTEFHSLLEDEQSVALGSLAGVITLLLQDDQSRRQNFSTYEKRILTLLRAHFRWIARVDDQLVHSVEGYQELLGAVEESERRLGRLGDSSRERTILAQERMTYHTLLDKVDFAYRALDIAVGQLANHIQHHARDRLGVLFLSGCRDLPLVCYLREQPDGLYAFSIFSMSVMAPHHSHPFDQQRRQAFALWNDLDKAVLIDPLFLRKLLTIRQRKMIAAEPNAIEELYGEISLQLGKQPSPPSMIAMDYDVAQTSSLVVWLKQTLPEALCSKFLRSLEDHGRMLLANAEKSKSLSQLERNFLACLRDCL